MTIGQQRQDELYQQAATEFGSAMARLVRAYEADVDQRRDLLQDIHLALWRSFVAYAGQCSLRTWVYRVAHNVAISQRIRRRKAVYVSLEEISEAHSDDNTERAAHDADVLAQLHTLIRQLRPTDAQVILLYLEDLDAAAIGEITGLSPRATATRIHRIKALLAARFNERGAS